MVSPKYSAAKPQAITNDPTAGRVTAGTSGSGRKPAAKRAPKTANPNSQSLRLARPFLDPTLNDGFDPFTNFMGYLSAVRKPHVHSQSYPHLYASDAGRCTRAVHYRLTHTDEPAEDLEPSTEIICAIGDYLHDTYMAMLALHFPATLNEVKWGYPDPAHPLITGRCDGIYTRQNPLDPSKTVRVALELKTKSKWQYTQILSQASPYMDNLLQAAMSGLVLQTEYIEIVYIARDYVAPDDPIVSFLYPTPLDAAKTELKRLLAAARSPKVPPREAAGEPITNIFTDKRCTYCRYRDTDCDIDGDTEHCEPNASNDILPILVGSI